MAGEHLILQRKDRDKLGERHEQFLKGDATSFVLVVVMADGTTHVDFDCVDALGSALMNKLGGGLLSAIEHLRTLALEERMKTDILNGDLPAIIDPRKRH